MLEINEMYNHIHNTTSAEYLWMEKPAQHNISAIHFEELSKVLPDFKMKFTSGELTCSCCGEPLKEAGIHSVEININGLVWICQNPQCVLSSTEE